MCKKQDLDSILFENQQRRLMNRRSMFRHIAVLTTSALSIVCSGVALAQTPAQSSAQTASTPKQTRKAERKAARAHNKAELKDLEKNGYRPGEGQTDYPQDVQNAERKTKEAAGVKAASAP
jgi:hypothetical protein